MNDNGAQCGKCGQPHNPSKCSGHKDLSDGTSRQCGNPPLRGATVCRYHGGSAPQVRAAIERRRASSDLERAVATFGLRRDIGHAEALLEELQWTAGHVEWLRARVQELEVSDLSWGVVEETEREGGGKARTSADVERTSRATVPVVVELYERERRHLLDVCKAAAAAKVDDALIGLAQATGEGWSRWLRWGVEQILAAVGLSVAALEVGQWERVRSAVSEVLRGVVSGGQPPSDPVVAIEGDGR